MNASGDAAEQVMRMSLEGAEVLIKLTGSGAKNAAVLLYSIYKEQNKTRGKERLSNMLRSGKPLKVYTFSSENLSKFKEVAKEYGVLYTVLKEKDDKDGVFDVLVRADDESKIKRIVERFKFTTYDTADLRTSMEKEKESKKPEERTPESSPSPTEKKDEEQTVEEKPEEKTDDEPVPPIVTAIVGDDDEKEVPERATPPSAEQNMDELAILNGEKPVTENPTMARQEREEPLPEKSITDEGKPSKETDKSSTGTTEKSSTMSSRTPSEQKPQEGESTSQPKSEEYKTPDGRVDISEVIKKKKEARAGKAKQEKSVAGLDVQLPKKSTKEER